MPKITVKLALYVFAAILLMLGGILLFAGYSSPSLIHEEINVGWTLLVIGLVIWIAGYFFRSHLK